MSFFEELKRRNVVRVGIAYVIGAWLLLQFTDVLSELLSLPDTVGPLVVAVVAVGLPIVLFAAWVFEITPEGIKRESDVDRSQSMAPATGKKLNIAIIVMLAVALTYFIWESRFAAQETAISSESVQAQPAAEPAPEVSTEEDRGPERQSIAVLPFENRSRIADDQPFVEGVHDDLLTNLARISSLKVISRTSVNQYQGTTKTIPQIASELDVATVMEGAVQRSGDQIRINVQLIDAQTDEHLWAQIYDRELTAVNLFQIQSEISEAIAEALEATLTDAEQDRINAMPTDNLQAYDAYVRGRQLMESYESAQVIQAEAELRQAVALDPEFALAWVALADHALIRALFGDVDINEAKRASKAAVDNALALDDQLGEAWASRGWLFLWNGESKDAELAFQKAIELSPGYAPAFEKYAALLSAFEMRTDERVALMEQAVALEPRSAEIATSLAQAYWDQGRYLRSEQQLLGVLEWAPDFPLALTSLAQLYSAMGRWAEGVMLLRRAAQKDSDNPNTLALQSTFLSALGMTEEADEIQRELESRFPDNLITMSNAIDISLDQGQWSQALEQANAIFPKIGRDDFTGRFLSEIYTFMGQEEEARRQLEQVEPGWMDEQQWPSLTRKWNQGGACGYAWLLLNTGDQDTADRLLAQTIQYMAEELPTVDEHADRSGIEDCYLIAGDKEAAYRVLETQIAHNHTGKTYWLHDEPWFELIRSEARYRALQEENDRRIAEQRELLQRLEAEAAGP